MPDAMRDDWKQAWKDEVARAERAEAENRRLRSLLAQCRDWFDAPGGDPNSREILTRINEVLGYAPSTNADTI